MAKITIPANLENLESMIRFIEDGAKKQGFNSKKTNQIKVAAEEALVNVINYAYPDKSGDVEVIYNATEGKGLVIEIIDWGVPFDPLSLPDPDTESSMEDREIGGLGVYMMRNIMDRVYYEREGDRNILTLVKH